MNEMKKSTNTDYRREDRRPNLCAQRLVTAHDGRFDEFILDLQAVTVGEPLQFPDNHPPGEDVRWPSRYREETLH